MKTAGRAPVLCVLLVSVIQLCSQPAQAGEEVSQNKVGAVALELIEPTTILVLPVRGSLEQHPAVIGQLMMYAGQKGLIRGAPFGVYYDDPEKVPEDSLKWEVGVPIPPGSKADAPFVVREQPQMKAAVAMCTGPYEGAESCYGALVAWVTKNGYVVTGPVQEHWLSDMMSTTPEKLQARIVFPVAKK